MLLFPSVNTEYDLKVAGEGHSSAHLKASCNSPKTSVAFTKCMADHRSSTVLTEAGGRTKPHMSHAQAAVCLLPPLPLNQDSHSTHLARP